MSDGDELSDRSEAIFAALRARAAAEESSEPGTRDGDDVGSDADAEVALRQATETNGAGLSGPDGADGEAAPVEPAGRTGGARQPEDADRDGDGDQLAVRSPPAETSEEIDTPVSATPAPPSARPVRMPDEAVTMSVEPPAADRDAGHPAPAEERTDASGHPLPRIFAVANQKGGVGKTTTAVNLAAALADAGYRTLVVDLDPQGNASTGLGINIRDLQLSMYDVIIHEARIDDTIEATAMKNLFVAPASLDLAGAEIELVPVFSRELRLRHALDEVRDQFDYVLIDCPPSLGLLTVNGLAAAAEVLVPIQCEYYALEGLGQLLRNVSLVQRNVNQALELSTFVCVMYDARTKLADQVVAEVREHFGDKVCRIVIPRTVRLSEAPSYGQPILAFDPRSRGAIAYRELAREVSGGPVENGP